MNKKFKDFILRPQVWGFFVGIAVMAAIALVFFYPDNFQGNSLRQPDMVQGLANGHEGQLWEQQTGEKALWTNSLFGGMPTFQISPSYPSNSLFEWVNTVYGLWLPSPSNLLFMMMMGFFILMYALRKRWYYALIGAVAWGLSSYFIIIIGAGHIWKFLALTYVPPTIAGVILLFRGRYVLGTALTAFFAMMQLAANHPQMSYYFGIVMAVIAICYLIDSLRRKQLRRWATACGLTVLAGVLALGANAPSLYNTYEYAKFTKRAQSELADDNTANTAAQSSERPTGGLPRAEILGWSYGTSEMFSLVVPDIKGGASGKPVQGNQTMVSLADLEEAAQFQPSSPQGFILNFLPQYFNDSEGTNGPVYAGVIMLALFILGCFIVKGPLKWAMLACTLLSCLLALGYNAEWLSDAMIYHFPLYNKFRAVESILVIAEFAIPLLGVLALAQFLEAGKDAWKRYGRKLTISFGIPAFFALLALAAPSVYGSFISNRDQVYQNQAHQQILYQCYISGATQQEANELLYTYSLANPQVRQTVEALRSGMVRSDGLRSFVFVVLAFGILAIAGSGRAPRWTAVAGVGLLVLVDLFGVDRRYVDHESFCAATATADIEPDAIDNAIMADTTSHYRVLDIPGFNDPRRSYFHSMIGGYHAAKLNRYEDVLRTVLAPAQDPSFNPAVARDEADRAAMRMANMLNARYIITADAANPLILNPGAMGNAWLVDNIELVDGARAEIEATASVDVSTTAVADCSFADALPDAPSLTPGDTIYLTRYTPNTLTYHASVANSALGVFSEVYFPWGWKATIDGQPTPLARVNYILRAMAIPAGSHTIEMTFDPDSIHTTGAVAYACVSLVYLLLLLGVFVQARRWRLF